LGRGRQLEQSGDNEGKEAGLKVATAVRKFEKTVRLKYTPKAT
jgi:hypothetical protein